MYDIKFHVDGDLTVMQYTGRKDKYDREIYEGDIIEYTDGTNSLVVGEIVFALCQWKVCCRETKAITNLYSIPKEVTRVIGNVYEGRMREYIVKGMLVNGVFAKHEDLTKEQQKEADKS